MWEEENVAFYLVPSEPHQFNLKGRDARKFGDGDIPQEWNVLEPEEN
jgi:hypothetical protein